MRVNNGLTPQDLKAYGINDVQDIVHNPTTTHCIRRSSTPIWKGMSVAY
nr:phosphoenolpyruvate carboxykinase [Raoultella sp. NCTC 9187]